MVCCSASNNVEAFGADAAFAGQRVERDSRHEKGPRTSRWVGSAIRFGSGDDDRAACCGKAQTVRGGS